MMEMVRRDATNPDSTGTFSNLGKLPRVPLPTLDDSLRRFEDWCAPLLSENELKETRDAIAAFRRPGETLQRELVAYEQRDDVYSWLDSFWPARYLGRRVPVSINANFVMSFRPAPLSQAARAARLVVAATHYKQALDEESIPAKVHRGTPLCMIQNKYLFSSTRIPGVRRDMARTPYSETEPGPSSATHILVIYKHQLFKLDVYSEQGRRYDLGEIESAISALMTTRKGRLATRDSAGYLTTLPRTEWAQVRGQLMARCSSNPARMDDIEKALFCLCLDDTEPRDHKQLADQLLHGDGGNRWFDKSVSLIVCKNGEAGINVEHCGLDGTTIVDFVDYLHDESVLDAIETEQHREPDLPSYSAIDFELSDALSKAIMHAADNFNELAENTATRLFSFDQFGSDHIKSLGISPDAFAQLGFQLAHYRSKGLIGATYESIATRHFDRGRTEAMRVVTPEIIDFVMQTQSASATPASQRDALRKAATKHVDRVRDCQAGRAPEQHLWQLLLIAEEHGNALGTGSRFKLFDSPGWLKMRNDYLSTSSAPSDNITVFGFGATSEQCIGTAYLVRKDSIKAYLSTPASVAEQMTDFAEQLEIAFQDMAAILEHG